MARPPRGTPLFPTLTEWYALNPNGVNDALQKFNVIPDSLHQKLTHDITHTGDDALQVWQNVSQHLVLYQQHIATGVSVPAMNTYFTNIGVFTTLCAIFEDRLNSLFHYRCTHVFGNLMPKNPRFVDIPRKAAFLCDYDDIDVNMREGLRKYAEWRNAIVHQIHYHDDVLQPVVFEAIYTLYQIAQRLRQRQKSVLTREKNKFPTHDVSTTQLIQLVQAAPRATVAQIDIHHVLGGGYDNLVPFRLGQPIYAVVNNANNALLQGPHVGNIDIWGALNSANRIWHNVPVFIKTGQGLQYIAQKSLYIESVTLNRVTFTTL